MKLPHDLELDPDYQASKRAIHRTIEGKSGAIAKRLGIPGENGGRILRNLGTIERTDKPGDLYRLARLIEAAEQEGAPEPHAAIHWLNERFNVLAPSVALSAIPVAQLPGALVDLTACFGKLLAAFDQLIADGLVSPGELVDLLLAVQRFNGKSSELVDRLASASRKKGNR